MRGFLEELPPEGKLGKTSCHFEIELSFISYMQTLKIHFNQLPECQHYSEFFFPSMLVSHIIILSFTVSNSKEFSMCYFQLSQTP